MGQGLSQGWVLLEAYRRCRANAGASGVDSETFERIDTHGVERWLETLWEELTSGKYVPKRRILSWSEDRTLRLWDAATDAPIGAPMKHEGSVYGALFAPDGRRILSWSEDRTLRLWDAATDAPIGAPMKHEGPVYGALFAPDKRRILSWSEDKTLRLWDAATGAPIGAPMKHESLVVGALFAPDGRPAASCRGLKTRRLSCGTRRRKSRSASR